MSDRPPGYPDTPTLDKMLEVKEKSQTIGEFLDWLFVEKGYVLAVWTGDEPFRQNLQAAHLNIERQLAEYFDIDLKAANREQFAVMDWLRAKREAEQSADATSGPPLDSGKESENGATSGSQSGTPGGRE